MRQPFDESTKAFLRRWLEARGVPTETEAEVFSRGRSIDIVAHCSEVECAGLAGTVFAHFRPVNGLELKGIHDPLTMRSYNRILMRAWALGDIGAGEVEDEGDDEGCEERPSRQAEWEAEPLPWNRTLTIVCVTRPDRILDGLRDKMRFEPTGEPGIYRHDGQLPIWIIHPTELALIPGNYPLLPLARGKKLEQFIEVCLREGLTDYLQLVIDVGMLAEPGLVLRKILEMKQMKPVTVPEDTWKVIDELFRQSPGAPERLPTIRETLAEHERRAALSAEQRVLVHLLQRKFPQAPEGARRRIEAIGDPAELRLLADRILDARTLEDVGLGE